ncbi:MAG: hypothetical protein KDA71_03245 [Planctomycetales bacterium]|nr:hypothetical protein [Planctomycetales bacterium]
MEKPLAPQKPTAGAIVSVLVSAFGLLGWILLALLLMPYEDDVVKNVFTFGFNAIILLGGGAASAALSLSGLVASLVSLSHDSSRTAAIGIVLGAAGIVAGGLILIWRFEFVLGS